MKSYLGFEDAGLTQFEAVQSHVLSVYCSYLLLLEVGEQDNVEGGTLARRRHLESRLRNETIGQILKANARFDAQRAIINQCSQVRQRMMAA